MASILYRLRRSVRRTFGATAGLTSIVAVLVGLVLTLVAGATRTLTAPDRSAVAFGGGYDVSIDQSEAQPTPAMIAALPGVDAVASVTFVFGALAAGHGTPVDALVFVGSVDAVVGTRLLAGREPQAGRVDEFVVSSSFLAQTGAHVGDRFDLSTLSQDQADTRSFDTPNPDGPTTSATVVGVFGGAAELQDGYVVAVFSPALLDLGDVGLGGGSSAAQLAPGTTMADLRAQLDTLPNGTDLTISELDWVGEAVRSAVRTQGQGLGVLALFSVAAAIVVIGQLLGRQYRLSDAERIVLRAVGMTRGQLLLDPLSRAAVPIVIGSSGAAVIAFFFSGKFPTGFVTQVEPQPGVRFDPLVHVAGPLAVAAVLVGWVAVGLAMSDRPRSPRTTTPIVGGVASRFRHVQLATGLRFAFSGARDRNWPAASFLGLTIVLSAVIGAFTMSANVAHLVDEPAAWGSAPLGIGSGGEAIPDSVRSVLATDPDVAAVTYYGTVTVSVGTDGLIIAGMQPARGELLPPVTAGRLPQSDDEVVLGAVAARTLGVGIGDEFEVSTESGAQRLRVTGLAVIPSVERGDGIGEGGVVTVGGLHRLDPAAPLNAGGLELRPDAPSDTVDRLSGVTGMRIGPPEATTEIVNLGRVRSIPLLVAAVLAAFAALSLVHQLIVSARQRRRDVGVLKALGADRGFVSAVVHVQATVFTVAVVVLAVPIGIVGGQSVYRFVTDRIGAQGDASVPLAALSTAIVAPLVLANVIAMLPARRARRLRPAGHLNRE